jgi:hypothetical protein
MAARYFLIVGVTSATFIVVYVTNENQTSLLVGQQMQFTYTEPIDFNGCVYKAERLQGTRSETLYFEMEYTVPLVVLSFTSLALFCPKTRES